MTSYRLDAAGVSAIICTSDGDTDHQVDLAEQKIGRSLCKILVAEAVKVGAATMMSTVSSAAAICAQMMPPCGNDPMLMFFTSGTTGYPKIAMHSYKYALGHFVTTKYWQMADRDSLHFTISEIGWGKLYGQWLCESAVFTYDFDRFDVEKILPMFAKYHITSFCVPPTMYRLLIKQDLSCFDLSSIQHATTGEALNPEVFYQFEEATELQIAQGFGQTETPLGIASLRGMILKPSAMGKPIPGYGIDLVDSDGNPVADGVNGEIVLHTENGPACGVFLGHYLEQEKTDAAWHDGLYYTGDLAWRDEDGYYWYVSRSDDVIKFSGYRILRAPSWSFHMFWSAVFPPFPTSSEVRLSRPA